MKNADGDDACSHGFTGLPEDCSRCARERVRKRITAAEAAAYEAGRREGVEQVYNAVRNRWCHGNPKATEVLDVIAALLPTPPPQAAEPTPEVGPEEAAAMLAMEHPGFCEHGELNWCGKCAAPPAAPAGCACVVGDERNCRIHTGGRP